MIQLIKRQPRIPIPNLIPSELCMEFLVFFHYIFDPNITRDYILTAAMIKNTLCHTLYLVPVAHSTIQSNPTLDQWSKVSHLYPYMEQCQHHPSSCDESCECHCNLCTDQFEINWNIFTVENNLCNDCGMPKEMTIESMFKARYTHFYQPCPPCSIPYKAIMTENKLCIGCQGALIDDKCPECFCTQEEACPCRQCIAYRKQNAPSQ